MPNRIIAIEQRDDAVVTTTTDIHFARRIAEAVQRAHTGQLDIDFDENRLFCPRRLRASR